MISDPKNKSENAARNVENLYRKLVENYNPTSVQEETGSDEDVEYCIISMPPDLPLASLNKLSFKCGTRKKELELNGKRTSFLVTGETENQSNQQVVKVTADRMIVKHACHKLDIRTVVESSKPNLDNYLPRALPPPVPGEVKIRFKPFGCQEPPEIKPKVKKSLCKSPKKKHKRSLGAKFEVQDNNRTTITENSDQDEPVKQIKKDDQGKSDQTKPSNSDSLDTNNNDTVNNDGICSTPIASQKHKKKKSKKKKEIKKEQGVAGLLVEGKLESNATCEIKDENLGTRKRKKDKKIKKEKDQNIFSEGDTKPVKKKKKHKTIDA